MKIAICCALLALSFNTAHADYGALDCVAGDCGGWEATYESTDNKYKFMFKNVSERAAFNIKILINCFDYFGDYLGRREIKVEGPIYKQIPYLAILHPKTSKVTYDIYWSDRHGGQIQPEFIKGE